MLQIFVGLGFPYEGPAPLEAIANGAVFLNPRFSPPHNNKNTAFFRHKPTERKVCVSSNCDNKHCFSFFSPFQLKQMQHEINQ